MGPGKNKAIIATDHGLRINFKALAELPKALAYGVAVFPRPRELIVLVVMWLLLLRRGGGVLCSLGGLALFLLGLEFIRAGGEDYYAPTLWLQWAGFAGLVAGFATLLLWGGRNARNAATVEAQFTSEAGPTDKRM